jgi:hypothetical protein
MRAGYLGIIFMVVGFPRSLDLTKYAFGWIVITEYIKGMLAEVKARLTCFSGFSFV